MSKIRLSNDVGIYGLLDMDLLWTNANSLNEFASQTVSLNLSKYSLVLIKFRSSNNTSAPFVKEVSQIDNLLSVAGGMPSSNAYVYRRYTASQNGIAFANAVFISYPSLSANIADNTRMIPYQIYGIK